MHVLVCFFWFFLLTRTHAHFERNLIAWQQILSSMLSIVTFFIWISTFFWRRRRRRPCAGWFRYPFLKCEHQLTIQAVHKSFNLSLSHIFCIRAPHTLPVKRIYRYMISVKRLHIALPLDYIHIIFFFTKVRKKGSVWGRTKWTHVKYSSKRDKQQGIERQRECMSNNNNKNWYCLFIWISTMI